MRQPQLLQPNSSQGSSYGGEDAGYAEGAAFDSLRLRRRRKQPMWLVVEGVAHFDPQPGVADRLTIVPATWEALSA